MIWKFEINERFHVHASNIRINRAYNREVRRRRAIVYNHICMYLEAQSSADISHTEHVFSGARVHTFITYILSSASASAWTTVTKLTQQQQWHHSLLLRCLQTTSTSSTRMRSPHYTHRVRYITHPSTYLITYRILYILIMFTLALRPTTTKLIALLHKIVHAQTTHTENHTTPTKPRAKPRDQRLVRMPCPVSVAAAGAGAASAAGCSHHIYRTLSALHAPHYTPHHSRSYLDDDVVDDGMGDERTQTIITYTHPPTHAHLHTQTNRRQQAAAAALYIVREFRCSVGDIIFTPTFSHIYLINAQTAVTTSSSTFSLLPVLPSSFRHATHHTHIIFAFATDFWHFSGNDDDDTSST